METKNYFLTNRTWVRLRRVTQILFLALFLWLFLKAEFGGQETPGLAGGPVLSLRPPDPGGPPPDLQPPGGRALLVPGLRGLNLHPGPVFLRLGLPPGHHPGRGPAAAVYGPARSRRGGPVAPGQVLPADRPAGQGPVFLESGGAVRSPVPALPQLWPSSFTRPSATGWKRPASPCTAWGRPSPT